MQICHNMIAMIKILSDQTWDIYSAAHPIALDVPIIPYCHISYHAISVQTQHVTASASLHAYVLFPLQSLSCLNDPYISIRITVLYMYRLHTLHVPTTSNQDASSAATSKLWCQNSPSSTSYKSNNQIQDQTSKRCVSASILYTNIDLAYSLHMSEYNITYSLLQ